MYVWMDMLWSESISAANKLSGAAQVQRLRPARTSTLIRRFVSQARPIVDPGLAASHDGWANVDLEQIIRCGGRANSVTRRARAEGGMGSSTVLTTLCPTDGALQVEQVSGPPKSPNQASLAIERWFMLGCYAWLFCCVSCAARVHAPLPVGQIEIESRGNQVRYERRGDGRRVDRGKCQR